jgi:BON domain-containing protein
MHLSAPRIRPIAAPTRARSALPRRGRKAADRPRMSSMLAAATAGGIAVGMLFQYFLDPGAGRRRRHIARDRVLSRMRRGERRIVVRARRAESHAVGVARRTINARRPQHEPLDDVTLAHKVESQLYRGGGAPKGRVNVNAEEGVVFLRGTMEREEDILRLGAAARRIAGVQDVENLLHAPGTPAPASRSKLERRRSSE